MADLVKIDPTSKLGSEAYNAVKLIREGFGILKKLNGVRAQCIGTSAAEMESAFGIDSGDGQFFSDRWGAILAWFDGSDADAIALRDFLDATIPQ